MTKLHPDLPIRGDFADVLDSVGGGFAGADDDGGEQGQEPPEALAPSNFDFLQALDAVAGRQAADAPPPGSDYLGRYADAGLESGSEFTQPDRPLDQIQAETAAEMSAQPAHRDEASAAPALGPCDPMSLAIELGLRPGLAPAELRRMRRVFALANHPDRLDPSLRELASRRMTLANALIDAALRLAARRP